MAQRTRTSSPGRKKRKGGIRLPLADENGNGNGNGCPSAYARRKANKEREIARIARWMKKNLPPPGTPEWEALCTHCGKCCYDKVWIGSRLHLLTSACQFYDTDTQKCTCYENRFENEPLCMPIGPEIVQMGGLPADCPYVEGLPGYRPPKELNKTIDEV